MNTAETRQDEGTTSSHMNDFFKHFKSSNYVFSKNIRHLEDVSFREMFVYTRLVYYTVRYIPSYNKICIQKVKSQKY